MSPALVSPSPASTGTIYATPNFDHLARAYRWMEWATFGPFLTLCRAAFLPRLINCRNALVLGDGDGRFTARLLQLDPHLRVHAIDASSGMLAALTRVCGSNASRLTTERADLRIWKPDATPTGIPAPIYDLVVTHFFLDCLSTNEVLALAMRIRPVVSPGALWVVSEFAVPPGWFGKLVAGPTVQGLYLAFGLLTGLRPRALPDHSSPLTAAGFSILERRPRLGGLLVSEIWAAANSS